MRLRWRRSGATGPHALTCGQRRRLCSDSYIWGGTLTAVGDGTGELPSLRTTRQSQRELSGGVTPSASAMDQLGDRIRRARQKRGMGVRELAREVDCSASMISQIERGTTKPSVSTLYAISTALDISTDSLIAGTPEQGGRATRASSGPIVSSQDSSRYSVGMLLRRGDRRVINLERGVQWQLLMPDPDPSVEFMEVIYEPGGGSMLADHAIRHNGRESFVVLEGVLRVEIGFESYSLDSGDSMTFDSTIPHRFWNEGATPVRGIWFILDRM